MHTLVHLLAHLILRLVSSLQQAFLHLTQPSRYSVVLATAADLTRTRSELLAENALLRQQLIILHCQVKKPAFTQSDRLWLVLLASRVKNWKEHLLILRPDTLLHWHRQGFRLFWKFKSRNPGGRPKLATETIALIYPKTPAALGWGFRLQGCRGRQAHRRQAKVGSRSQLAFLETWEHHSPKDFFGATTMTDLGTLAPKIQTFFNQTANTVAGTVGFVERTSKLTGALFLQTLTFGFLDDPVASLTELTETSQDLGHWSQVRHSFPRKGPS